MVKFIKPLARLFPEPRVNGYVVNASTQTDNYGQDSNGTGDATAFLSNQTTSPPILTNIQGSIHNQTQILYDVSDVVRDSNSQFGTLIPVAWVTLALFLIRFLTLMISWWPKAPIKRNLPVNNVFDHDLRDLPMPGGAREDRSNTEQMLA